MINESSYGVRKSKNKCPICGNDVWIMYACSSLITFVMHRALIVDTTNASIDFIRNSTIYSHFDECTNCGTVIS